MKALALVIQFTIVCVHCGAWCPPSNMTKIRQSILDCNHNFVQEAALRDLDSQTVCVEQKKFRACIGIGVVPDCGVFVADAFYHQIRLFRAASGLQLRCAGDTSNATSQQPSALCALLYAFLIILSV